MRAASLLSLGMAVAGHAQVLTDDGAGLFVQNGALLTVKGEVLIAASGTITNSGTIDLSGNWTNNAGNDCFGASEGTVILNSWQFTRNRPPNLEARLHCKSCLRLRFDAHHRPVGVHPKAEMHPGAGCTRLDFDFAAVGVQGLAFVSRCHRQGL